MAPTKPEQDLISAVDLRCDWMTHHLAELVSINTVNRYSGDPDYGNEGAGQQYIAPVLTELGASKVDLFDCPDDIYARMGIIGPRGREFGGRPNLVATFDFGPGPVIVLCAHMDTVAGSGMSIAPFTPELRAGRLYGRGSGDDKSGIAAILTALAALSDAGVGLSGRIYVESVVEEECSGSGAGTLSCIERGYVGDVAIVADGYAGMIHYGCSGCMEAGIHVPGFATHASDPSGVSAFDKAVVVKRGIDELGAKRVAEDARKLLNIGVVRSGNHPAVVPGEAYMGVNVNYLSSEASASEAAGCGWGGAQVRDEFEAAVRGAEAADPWLRNHPSEIEWVKDLEPFAQSPDDPWIASYAECAAVAWSNAPVVGVMSAWADAAWEAAKGHMPTILSGACGENAAHSGDESVKLADVMELSRSIALFLARHLGR